MLVVTAGLARRPGMSREDLLAKNARIIRDIGQKIKTHCPRAFVIMVTNPLDAMVWVMIQATGFPPHQIAGMAGALDASRFCSFLAQELGVHTDR